MDAVEWGEPSSQREDAFRDDSWARKDGVSYRHQQACDVGVHYFPEFQRGKTEMEPPPTSLEHINRLCKCVSQPGLEKVKVYGHPDNKEGHGRHICAKATAKTRRCQNIKKQEEHKGECGSTMSEGESIKNIKKNIKERA